MTTVAAVAVAGLAASWAGWWFLAAVFDHPALVRSNIRDRPVPTAGGIVAVLAGLVLWALAALAAAQTSGSVSPDVVVATTVAVSALATFGFIGVVDDLLGGGEHRGFAGHLGTLVSRRPSTGAVKLVAGGVVAVGLSAVLGPSARSLPLVLADAVLLALAANLANLLDRAPGRTTKVSVIALAVLVIAAAPAERHALGGTTLVVAVMAGLLVAELREEVMLGDAGANPLGAGLGIGVLLTCGPTTRLVVLVALVVLNLLSERVSFSRVITATPGLRHLDLWGRRRE